MKLPRRCSESLVFNEITGYCDHPENNIGCRNKSTIFQAENLKFTS